MKSCPLCNRTYSNEAFNYCPVDGAILSNSVSGSTSSISNPPSFDGIADEPPTPNKHILEDVVLPYLGTAISKATVTKWHKRVGEAVKQDEPLFEVSTDKADLEYSSVCSGELCEILVQVGQTIPINTVVARIRRLNMKG